MTKHILIVEDEVSIAEVLIAYCEREGYTVKHLQSGYGVVAYVKENAVDLMLLDIMLPGIDGLSVCKEIRIFSHIPIIMVTAKGEDIDRLFGLEFGADDYICKPFNPREVVARIKAVLRRFDINNGRLFKHSGFEIDPEKYKVTFRGETLALTPVEFRILELLIKREGCVYSREEILEKTYSETIGVSDRNIDTHIKNIRKKINRVSTGYNPICSVYGVGYKFQSD